MYRQFLYLTVSSKRLKSKRQGVSKPTGTSKMELFATLVNSYNLT